MTGLQVARYLIGIKLAGEAAIAREDLWAPEVADSILHLAPLVDQSSTLEEIRHLEASAASRYWSAWERSRHALSRPIAHGYRTIGEVFEGRRSARQSGDRPECHRSDQCSAELPVSPVEAEGHLATVAVGLDPGMGVLHADTKGPSQLRARPHGGSPSIGRTPCHAATSVPTPRWRDFHEDTRGVVRVLSPLTHRLPRPCRDSPPPWPRSSSTLPSCWHPPVPMTSLCHPP